jgi:sodium/bile acid cotransporter 7
MLRKLPVDPYLLLILTMVGLAALFPARGLGASAANVAADAAIALLFFLYGARLSPQAALAGLRNWRLHLTVMLATFVAFPLVGLAMAVLVPAILTPALYVGVMFLCCLPSTVQSSIAFTSIARGNVAAAICAASASNLLGILLTPLLVGLLLSSHGGGFSLDSLFAIILQLFVPFAAGQVLRPWIGKWVVDHRALLNPVDRVSILIVVYVAFSEGVVSGIWNRVTPLALVEVLLADAALLAVILLGTTLISRLLKFSREDEITVVFCGSKKSLASGLPMASVLFAGHDVGLVVLPLMLFHQIQLMVCATMARRYGRMKE